jgi:hypothetical protein
MSKDFLQVLEEGDKLESSLQDVTKRIPDFNRKLDGFIKLIANESGMASHKRAYLLKEAEGTSDFPLLFGTVLERSLYAKYKADPGDWRSYIKTGTQNDFRPQDILGVYGLGNGLSVVAPRGEYKHDANLGEGKVSISLSKYGREFGLSWETIINDDLGAFSDIAERFALAALRTEYRLATSLIAGASGPHASLFGATITHPIDGKAITNKFTNSTFGIDKLGVAAAAMRRFVDADDEPVIFDGFELVVPPALEIPAMQALNPAAIIQSAGDATSGKAAIIRSSANSVPQLNITLHVNPYLPILDTSGNVDKTWYLFGKLSNAGYAARINFLRGHEAPEICLKNPNKISLGGGAMSPLEGDFDSDSIMWRLRHIMGGKQVDPRYAAAFIGA